MIKLFFESTCEDGDDEEAPDEWTKLFSEDDSSVRQFFLTCSFNTLLSNYFITVVVF